MPPRASSSADGARPARRRQQLTEEQREERRRRDREQTARRRASETSEQREARLAAARDATRARRTARRNSETEEQRRNRLDAARDAARASRARENEERRTARLNASRDAARARRSTQTESERVNRQIVDQVSTREARADEHTPVREARQDSNRTHMREAREMEDTPARNARQDSNRTQMREAREMEDTPARSARQDSSRTLMREAREMEDTPARSARQESNRTHMVVARDMEDTPDRITRQEVDRTRTQQARDSEHSVERQRRLAVARQSRRVSRRLFDDTDGYLDFGPMDVECRCCGAYHFLEERLRSSPVHRPAFSTCCGNGKLSFPAEQAPPPFLAALLTGTETRDRRFRANLRAYNNVLSMASVVAKWVSRGLGASNYNPTMTMQGQIYHYMGPLLPSTGRDPAFLSVYIHDTDYAGQSQIRSGHVRGVDQSVLTELTAMLHQVNPYVQTFRSLREWAHNDNAPAPYQMVIHADRRPVGEHVRRYNGPETSEVAALIPGNEDGQISRRDILVRRRGELNNNGNEVLDTISVSHRSYDPLSYVLLFPYGQDGWHPELRLSSGAASSSTARPRRRNKVTPLMFYTWRLFGRPSEFSTILRAGRLFQQYLVDQYCKIEAERLSYLRQHQQTLRASDYTSLRESLGDSGRAQDEADAVRAGRLFILPSTHIGGDRYMRQQMHDIIAISNKIGHPDIFLTVTCNPNWPEIRRSLLGDQKPQDRPDLCARVFRLKLTALMSYVIDRKLFGTVVAHVRVIEFQKRGLPHAHVIFWLDEHSKNELRTPTNVDRIISAEIPPDTDEELRELVLKHMIHTPCGSENPSAVCMGERYCRKSFPKDYRNDTSQTESEFYIMYKRRDPQQGGESLQRQFKVGRAQKTFTVNNSWVVPHSPKLLRMFACHINVELCVSRVGGIKYLFKYVCKGSDRVTMEIIADNERYDEISNFQDARYVSASEAVWRIFGFDIVDRNPPVVRLDVHLENHHTVVFEEGQERAASERPRPGTKLTEWFKANEKHPGARHIKYDDFPKYFTWNQSGKTWTPRANLRRRNPQDDEDLFNFSGPGSNVIGRIYTVSPREGERYFLRLLLTQVPGATSFQHLRTVEDVPCPSFRQACSMMGLLADDAEWRHAIRESFRSSFVPLSRVFATILAYCEPSDPRELWNEHVPSFLADIRARARGNSVRRQQLSNDQQALSYVLMEVRDALQSMSRYTLADCNLPEPMEDLPALHEDSSTDSAHVSTEVLEQRIQHALPLFNEGQTDAFNRIVGSMLPGVSVQSLQGLPAPPLAPMAGSSAAAHSRVFLLDAPGGTGKTFLTNAIQNVLTVRSVKVVAVATSAVAAVLLDGGRTAHSVFKIPIPILSDSTCAISANSALAQDMRDVDLIIWDEIVMCQRFCIEAVDRTLRDLNGTDLPFGGKHVLFSGDFRQILPVVPGGSRGQIVNACIRSSSLFASFKTLSLTENMRLSALRADPNANQEALQFAPFLLQVGEGRIRGPHHREMIPLPASVRMVRSVFDLCRFIFEDIATRHTDLEWLTSRVILATKNSALPQLNEIVGDMIPGPYRVFLSADKVEDEETNALRYPVELLNTLTAGSSLPDHRLLLKKGFVVMLLRNLDPTNGHVNGARYVIQSMSHNLLCLRLATGIHKGKHLALPRMPCGPGDDNFPVPGFIRVQFPVRTCFAITTNKAQGQSFGGLLGLDFRSPCFSHGQLYVALSRTTHPGNVSVLASQSGDTTRNVVYPEVLS